MIYCSSLRNLSVCVLNPPRVFDWTLCSSKRDSNTDQQWYKRRPHRIQVSMLMIFPMTMMTAFIKCSCTKSETQACYELAKVTRCGQRNPLNCGKCNNNIPYDDNKNKCNNNNISYDDNKNLYCKATWNNSTIKIKTLYDCYQLL